MYRPVLLYSPWTPNSDACMRAVEEQCPRIYATTMAATSSKMHILCMESLNLNCMQWCNSTLIAGLQLYFYTEVLRAEYSTLSTKLDAHLVAVHMYQRNALTLRDLQSIQSLRDRPVEAAETLLNIIIEQPDAVYLCFLDVLKHAGQQHIYQRLVEDGYKGE